MKIKYLLKKPIEERQNDYPWNAVIELWEWYILENKETIPTDRLVANWYIEKIVFEKPKAKSTIEMWQVINICQDILERMKDDSYDTASERLDLEKACMEAIFGKEVWDYLNQFK